MRVHAWYRFGVPNTLSPSAASSCAWISHAFAAAAIPAAVIAAAALAVAMRVAAALGSREGRCRMSPMMYLAMYTHTLRSAYRYSILYIHTARSSPYSRHRPLFHDIVICICACIFLSHT